MRVMIILVLGLFTLPALAGESEADAKTEVNALVDGFHAAAARSDFDDYFSRFTDDAYFLGTDATERWSVPEFKAYAKPAFDTGRGWTYEVLVRNVESAAGDGSIMWFDEILMNATLGRCRGTGVVVKESGQWKIAHYSLTLLIPNDIADSVGRQSMTADGIDSFSD